MVDVMSVRRRSLLMSRIRGKNTSPELKVRMILWHNGFRYRLHSKALPGKPDIVFAKLRAAIFVHGCFWHRHEGCPYFRLPKTQTSFWDMKLSRNQERDADNVAALVTAGWRVAIVWECGVRLDTAKLTALLGEWLEHGTGSIELAARDGDVQCTSL